MRPSRAGVSERTALKDVLGLEKAHPSQQRSTARFAPKRSHEEEEP